MKANLIEINDFLSLEKYSDMEHIKEALFKLDDFCSANRIEYIVTGTTALSMLGVPSRPQDIDIKVLHLNEEQKAKLKELQFLSGLEIEDYEEGDCYSFMISGIKINAIIDKVEKYYETMSEKVVLSIVDEHNVKHHLINVQLVDSALRDKMKLKRYKDKAYMLNLIAILASL